MPLDEDELYQERILDHYEEPFHRGHCPAATHAHEDENPLCGDLVRVELAIEPDGTFLDFDVDEVRVSQTIIAQARKVILTLDSSKLGRPAPVRIGGLDDVDYLVTDEIDDALATACDAANVTIVRVI